MDRDYPLPPVIGVESKCEELPARFPAQHQDRMPGLEYLMTPRPVYDRESYVGSGKLKDRVALITGGDSGIGRAVAVAFAKEGANVAIGYLYEHEDAAETVRAVEAAGRRCLPLPGDIRSPAICRDLVERTLETFGRLDVLVNNAAVQYLQESLLGITDQQLETTFRTNVFAAFYLTRAALPHLKRGAAIINTTSITAYDGEKRLIDYSATKGALVTFTRSLAINLVEQGIRVNAVAPGPIWTPFIPASFPAREIPTFGTDTPMKRAGQPFELAPAYVYLASDDSGYVTGQVLHVNGGRYRSS